MPPASVSSLSPTPALATSIATASPVASPASPAPTPIGFVLPQDCSYVRGPLPASPAPATPVTYWEFTCAGAATPDLKAVERIAPAFAQQGWTSCPSNPGTGVWWKGTSANHGESVRALPDAGADCTPEPGLSVTAAPFRGLAVRPDGSIYVLAGLTGATTINRLRPVG